MAATRRNRGSVGDGAFVCGLKHHFLFISQLAHLSTGVLAEWVHGSGREEPHPSLGLQALGVCKHARRKDLTWLGRWHTLEYQISGMAPATAQAGSDHAAHQPQLPLALALAPAGFARTASGDSSRTPLALEACSAEVVLPGAPSHNSCI